MEGLRPSDPDTSPAFHSGLLLFSGQSSSVFQDFVLLYNRSPVWCKTESITDTDTLAEGNEGPIHGQLVFVVCARNLVFLAPNQDECGFNEDKADVLGAAKLEGAPQFTVLNRHPTHNI